MANYSKWDKYAADLSDSDSEDQGPQLTTFDEEGGKSIEIGPQGYKVKEDKQKDNLSSGYSKGTVEVLSSSSNVSDVDIANESKNGATCEGYSWSQDRYEVILTVIIDANIKAKDITLTYSEKVLKIGTLLNKNSILSGTLRYDVVTNTDRKDDEVSGILDWEIKNKMQTSDGVQTSRRVLEVVMHKKCPIPGAFIWWKNVFVDDSYEIDVTKISGRSASDLKNTDNFVEAHKQFASYVSTLQPIEVECSKDSSGAEGDKE